VYHKRPVDTHIDPQCYKSRSARRRHFHVNRLLYELDPIPSQWVKPMTVFDEIWVPSEFLRVLVVQTGIAPEKVVVVPEPVDSDFFDPDRLVPLSPTEVEDWRGAVINPDGKALEVSNHVALPRAFRFLSVFKWEERKGPEVLIEAILSAFSNSPTHASVTLILATFLFAPLRSMKDFRDPALVAHEIISIIGDLMRLNPGWSRHTPMPSIVVITHKLTELEMARLFRSCDAFVLPTRGEGWGLPVVQAMSMRLAPIVTNYSAMADYLDDSRAYLIPIEGVQAASATWLKENGAPKSSRWAVPSTEALRRLLIQVHAKDVKSGAAGEKGRAAREYVKRFLHPDVVARDLMVHLRVVAAQRKQHSESPT
jgi:glycosyltransferase involved in cell wall biosynthesis